MVSVDVKQHWTMCLGLEPRSCDKVEVDVLGSPSSYDLCGPKATLNGRLSCGSPRLVALGIFGALTKLKSAANDLLCTSQVALGLFGQSNAQASKVAQ